MTDKLLQSNVQNWCRHYGDELERFLSRKVGAGDAPDLVQEVYLRVLTYPMAAGIREPRAFLFRIATNLAVDHLRKRFHRSGGNGGNGGEIEAQEGVDLSGPYEAVNDIERLETLRAALAELPPAYRHAFLLNRFDELSHAEIAQRLGLSVKTVQRHIAKAFDHCLCRLER